MERPALTDLRNTLARVRELGAPGVARALKEQPRYWLRILRHTFRLFMDNRGPYQANALAYRSMLSMVPMLVFVVSLSAWIFGAKVDVGTDQLKQILKEYVVPRPGDSNANPFNYNNHHPPVEPAPGDTAAGPRTLPGATAAGPATLPGDTAASGADKTPGDIVDDIWVYVEKFKEEAESGTQGGFAILLLTSIFLINGIEVIFNNIWHIRRRRAYASRLLAYTAMAVLIPVLFGFSIYMTAQVQVASIESALNDNVVLKHIPLIHLTWGLLRDLGVPLATVWLLFLAMYKWLPNTKVETMSALIGSLVAAIAFELGKWGFSFFTARMVESRQLYWGPIGIFIVFLVWVYLIWWIILFCAQLTYVIQNYRYVLRTTSDLKGRFGDAYLACRLMLEIGRRHRTGEEVPTVRELAQQLKVEVPRIQAMLAALTDANLLILGTTTGKFGDYEEVYVPGRDLAAISLSEVVRTATDSWRLPPAALLVIPADSAQATPADNPADPEQILNRIFRGSQEAIELNLAVTFRELLEQQNG